MPEEVNIPRVVWKTCRELTELSTLKSSTTGCSRNDCGCITYRKNMIIDEFDRKPVSL